MKELNELLAILLFFVFIISFFIKSKEKFLVQIINMTNGIGIIYYAYGGTLYKTPSDLSIRYLILISMSINISYYFYVFFQKIKGIKKPQKNLNINDTLNISKLLYKYKFLFLLPVLYIIYYFNSFPLYNIIKGIAIEESSRPDVSGSLPRYYTFSVFLSSFTFPYLIQLYALEKIKYKRFFLVLGLIFLSLIVGDKSTLIMIVFYFVFIKGKVSLKKIILFTFFFLLFYTIVKSLYYRQLVYDSSYVFMESIFRRVCLIGPATFGTYIDYFLIDGRVIQDNFNHIKQFVFYLIYGHSAGGAPIFFPASFLSYIGLGYLQVFLVGLVFYIILWLRSLLAETKIVYMKESIMYLNFYGAIVLSQGLLSDAFIRWFIPLIMIITFDKFLRIKRNN